MLLLELPGKHRRVSGDWDPKAITTGIPDAAVARIRRAVRDHVPPGPCPRCRAELRSVRTDHGEAEDHTVWAVTCAVCDFHINLRAFENAGPAAPAFNTLVGSRPPPHRFRRFAAQGAGSFTVHAVIVYAAALAIGSKVATVQTAADTSMVFLTLEEQIQEPDEPEQQEPMAAVTLAAPPPKGFLTMDAILETPTEIPPVDLTQRFDPRDYSGKGQEGGVFTGVEGGLGEVPTTIGGLEKTYLEAAVDEPPEMLSHPPLRYPEMQRSVGLEGHVYLEFVVDTLGRAEPATIRALSGERAFEAPAIAMVLGSRFRPGRLRGHVVRVLVNLDVSFSLIRN